MGGDIVNMSANPVLTSATPDSGAVDVPRASLTLPVLVGVTGSMVLALGSNLPGSPFGPHAAGLWPLAGSGPAPGWEGPVVPEWAQLADQTPGLGPGRLLTTALIVVGVGLLAWAWASAWRRVRARPTLGLTRLWCMVGAWVAPMLLASPFASQDVWLSGAQGKMVVAGLGGYSPPSLLGHSVWTLAVDAKWASRPSYYGPGALNLSALFVRISGGRPWVAAECWRVTAVLGLALCAWGIHRIVLQRGGKATVAALVGAANPAVLLILVGGIHNDALMLGLTVSGVALALCGNRYWGIVLCALGAAVKPSALLAVGAVAWWGWNSEWRQRTKGFLTAAGAVVAVFVVSGLTVGGGFGWVRPALSYGSVPGPWSLGARFLGAKTGGPVDAIEIGGLILAIFLVIGTRTAARWTVGLGWAFAALAVTNPKPEPWYLAWAIVFLACGGLSRLSERAGVLVLVTMMAGSTVVPGPFWWFSGIVLLGWLGVIALRAPAGKRNPVSSDLTQPR
jgi:alpha-1,6-mannosyltransferase